MGGSTPCFKDVLMLLWSPDLGDRRMVNDVDRSQRQLVYKHSRDLSEQSIWQALYHLRTFSPRTQGSSRFLLLWEGAEGVGLSDHPHIFFYAISGKNSFHTFFGVLKTSAKGLERIDLILIMRVAEP